MFGYSLTQCEKQGNSLRAIAGLGPYTKLAPFLETEGLKDHRELLYSAAANGSLTTCLGLCENFTFTKNVIITATHIALQARQTSIFRWCLNQETFPARVWARLAEDTPIDLLDIIANAALAPVMDRALARAYTLSDFPKAHRCIDLGLALPTLAGQLAIKNKDLIGINLLAHKYPTAVLRDWALKNHDRLVYQLCLQLKPTPSPATIAVQQNNLANLCKFTDHADSTTAAAVETIQMATLLLLYRPDLATDLMIAAVSITNRPDIFTVCLHYKFDIWRVLPVLVTRPVRAMYLLNTYFSRPKPGEALATIKAAAEASIQMGAALTPIIEKCAKYEPGAESCILTYGGVALVNKCLPFLDRYRLQIAAAEQGCLQLLGHVTTQDIMAVTGAAATNNQLKIIKLLEKRITNFDHILCYGARAGHLEIVMWAIWHGATCFNAAVEEALFIGDENIVRALQPASIHTLEECARIALFSGQLSLAINLNPTAEDSYRELAIGISCMRGHQDRPIGRLALLDYAIQNNSLELLEFCRRTCTLAEIGTTIAHAGLLQPFVWFLKQDIPKEVMRSVFTILGANDNRKLLCCASGRYSLFPALTAAACKNNVVMLQWAAQYNMMKPPTALVVLMEILDKSGSALDACQMLLDYLLRADVDISPVIDRLEDTNPSTPIPNKDLLRHFIKTGGAKTISKKRRQLLSFASFRRKKTTTRAESFSVVAQ